MFKTIRTIEYPITDHVDCYKSNYFYTNKNAYILKSKNRSLSLSLKNQ